MTDKLDLMSVREAYGKVFIANLGLNNPTKFVY